MALLQIMTVSFCRHLLVNLFLFCCFLQGTAVAFTVAPSTSNVLLKQKGTYSSTQRVLMIRRSAASAASDAATTASSGSSGTPLSSNKDGSKDDKQQQQDTQYYYIPQQTNPRPLHQNWWPVSALYALEKDRPNALMVLEKPLVAVFDSSGSDDSSSWNVLDDRCSHRFAPLSEGRIVRNEESSNNSTTTCIQCAYHGWEFEASSGVCSKVPQEPDGANKARAVQTYPTRVDAGMLWVWTDPDTSQSLAPNIPLPINPLLREHVARRGINSCFMRDLPYGMEILGENLLDLSHLPFAHHSVGMLNRNFGGPLPTRMLSQGQRQENAQWEKKYNESVIVLPTFQAEILNASQHDPIFKGFNTSSSGPVGSADATPKEDWTTTVAYYDPCHVRYRRWRGTASHVELFMCPTSQGRSRVFLYNSMEQPPPAAPPVTSKSLRRRLAQLLAVFKPSTWKAVLFQRMLIKIQSGHLGHIFTHAIFDGDGIFLSMQGNRMKQAGLSYSDYSTPSSADILLNAYRRFVDTAAKVTRKSGSSNSNDKYDESQLVTMADAVVGMDNYRDDAPRSEMLDRYNTHTKFCPVCREALQRTRQTKRRLGQLQTALPIPVGAMTATAVLLLVLSKSKTAPTLAALAARSAWPMVAATAGVAWLASWAVVRAHKKLDQTINSFIFEDYVHAEKN